MNDTRTNQFVKAGEIDSDVNSYGTAVIGFKIYVIGKHYHWDFFEILPPLQRRDEKMTRGVNHA
jgi:hypothetical protein